MNGNWRFVRKSRTKRRRLEIARRRLLFWVFQALQNTSGCKNNQEQAATVGAGRIERALICSWNVEVLEKQ